MANRNGTTLGRRAFNATLVAAAAAMALPRRAIANRPVKSPATWLLFTKSAGFEHETIKRRSERPSILAARLAPMFSARGLSLVESKDGRLFEPDAIGAFAGFVFYTTGDLTTEGTDRQPPMTPLGKRTLLDAIARGTPFIGLHCASDTFHSPERGARDPYVEMLGGEFVVHGDQQRSSASIVAPRFPGAGVPADWTFAEEWYALTNFADDIRPIHVLNTAGMKGDMYARGPFPITWTRTHGRGRVFYTAIGHRDDVIASPAYRRLIGGAIDWCRSG